MLAGESPHFAVHLPFPSSPYLLCYSIPLHTYRVSCHLRVGFVSVSDISAVYLSIPTPLEIRFSRF